MKKPDNTLFQIGEVAKALGVTRKMILNYEHMGLLSPAVKDASSGYRYYTVDTLTRIKTIRILQNAGLSLSEIHDYYEGTSDLTPMVKRLETVRDELTLSIEKLRERISGGESAEIQCTVLPRQTIYRRTFRAESIARRTSELREVAHTAVQNYGIDLRRRMLSIEYPLDDPDEVSYCIAIPQHSRGEYVVVLPEARALMITFHGAYEEISAVRERLIAYAREQGIALAGTCRHIYLEGPPQHKDPKKFITQVALPIMEKRIENGK